MNAFLRLLGHACDRCPLCAHARAHPEGAFGRFMEWHGRFCPAWKAQKEIAREREAAPWGCGGPGRPVV